MQRTVFRQLSAGIFLIVSVLTVEVGCSQHNGTEIESCPAGQIYGYGCEVRCLTVRGEYLDCRHEETPGCVCKHEYCRPFTFRENIRGLECQQPSCFDRSLGKCVGKRSVEICDDMTKPFCLPYSPPGGWPSPRPFNEPTRPPPKLIEPIDCPENEVLGTGCELSCTLGNSAVRWNCANEEKPKCLCKYRHCRGKDSSCVKRSIELCWVEAGPGGFVIMTNVKCMNATAPGGWPSPRPVFAGLDQLPDDVEPDETDEPAKVDDHNK